MRSGRIAFALGVTLSAFVPWVPSLPWILGLLPVTCLLLWWPGTRRPALFVAGCCWLLLQARASLDARWPTVLENTDVQVQATIWSLPQPTERGLRTLVRIEPFCTAATVSTCNTPPVPAQPVLALVNIYEQLQLAPGQRWQWTLRLRQPRGFANPGGFDYEAWLLQQRIAATGYLRSGSGNRLLAEDTGEQPFNRWRQALGMRIEAAAGASLRYPHLIRALVTGDQSGISEPEWELFRATGTSHLIVISGSHVALVALLLYRCAAWLAARSATLVLRVPAQQIAAAAALAAAWCYAALAGFSLPVLRAAVMVTVLLLGRLLRRQTCGQDALSLALVLILLFDPFAPQNVGFWLSYCAVAVLVLTTEPALPGATRRHWLERIRLEWRTQWQVFVGLLPVLLLFFHEFSPLAPLVNMPAIPWIGLLTVPLCLLGSSLLWLWPAAGNLLLQFADLTLQLFMTSLAAVVAKSPFGVWPLPTLPLSAMVLLVALVLAVLFAPRSRQRLGALVLLPLFLFWPPDRLAAGRLRITVLDVGQGLAVVASTRNHHLLYDTGPWFSPRFDAGSDVVVPYLRYRNVRRLDRVIVSHADSDHAGGVAGVAAYWPAADYLTPEPAVLPEGVQGAPCRAGQSWQWDGVDFELLHPDQAAYDRNNSSCVLRIRIGEQVVLLPGDIERAVEHRLLLAALQSPLTLLVAPHHGSNSSSSPAFVTALRPEVVVHSSGHLNRFGHPAPAVVSRYAAVGTLQYRTSASGALSFELDASGIVGFEQWRQVRRRFWAPVAE